MHCWLLAWPTTRTPRSRGDPGHRIVAKQCRWRYPAAKNATQDYSVSTADALPLGGVDAVTDDQWKQWALAVFDGNDARATAAALAAAAARRAGASSDDLFAAAQAAYNNVASLSDAGRPMRPFAAPGDVPACLVRPSGRRTLGLTLIGILVAGTLAVVLRSATGDVVPVFAAAAVIMGVWYALSLRSSVRIVGDNVYVQGVLHRREFHRLDVRQITVQPRARQLGMINGPMRGQFIASFVGDDFAHLFELRQGAWTRGDIDRIGSAIGVRVIEDAMPSVT